MTAPLTDADLDVMVRDARLGNAAWADTLDLIAELRRLREEARELREALEPFAARARPFGRGFKAWWRWMNMPGTAITREEEEELQRAVRALAAKEKT